MNLVIWITLSFMIVAIESSTVATPGMSLTSTYMNPEVGSSVTLTCQNPDHSEITWRGPSGVYIIFASTCLRLSEVESTHITYISTTCGGGSSTLTINNFDPSRDSGKWSCSEYSLSGFSDSAFISLTGAASSVENIQITTELAFIDHYNTISLLNGEQETITCSADCQNTCQFTWHLNNQLVSSSAELMIDPPSSSGNYMCTASSGGDSLTKNVTINILSRNTIIFSPSDDIINVNEGDNVSVICDGMTNSQYCNSQMMFECYYSWNTWTYDGTNHELRYNNITLDKTGRYYCILEEYEQSSNTRISIYRSVQINVIGTVPTDVTSPSTSVTTPTTPSTSVTTPSTSATTPSTSVVPDVTTESASGGSQRYAMPLKKIVLVIVILIILQ